MWDFSSLARPPDKEGKDEEDKGADHGKDAHLLSRLLLRSGKNRKVSWNLRSMAAVGGAGAGSPDSVPLSVAGPFLALHEPQRSPHSLLCCLKGGTYTVINWKVATTLNMPGLQLLFF